METYLLRIRVLLNDARRALSEDDYDDLLDGAADELDARRDPSADADEDEEWEPEDD
jgi:hypothetical protein